MGVPGTEPPTAIETKQLGKRYGDTEALSAVDLEVMRGEIFGFLGPNGAGKSTLIRIRLGLLRPSAGSARVLGLDVVRHSVEIRKRIGYLPSGVSLYDSLTGRQLLDYLSQLQGGRPGRRAELCERMQLSASTLNRRVRDYSHGMRQKLGIVQALQHEPELVIMDEPSEALDPFMQQALYGILQDFRKAGGTVFFSSHILSEV